MLNETLARYSELFMYIAALIYTVVFVAFTWDVVKNSRVTRRLEGAAAPREAEKGTLSSNASCTRRLSLLPRARPPPVRVRRKPVGKPPRSRRLR